ncbi:MAG: DUF4364 family protein [Oscillospiraceae bacterium]|nr:DUF4364 family protein [Oscillospiraceae bacterium]
METRFGFIREKIDIKILILYILARCNTPTDFDTLADLTLCDDGISYFDFAECLDELVSSGHILIENGCYSITEKGLTNGKITESSVPFTIRRKTSDSVADYNAAEARKTRVLASITPALKGGYSVEMSLSDGIADVITLSMYADNEEQARVLRDGFRANAEKAYNAFLNELLK